MKCLTKENAYFPEHAQFEHLDRLEREMDAELKADCSKTDEWIDRLESELKRPDLCEEAKRRISWLLYRLMDGEYDSPEDIYAE